MAAGESKNPNKKHLIALADNFSMKRTDLIIDEVQTALSSWKDFAVSSNVGNESLQLIRRTIAHLIKT